MSKRREVAFQAIEGYNKWTIDAIMEYRDESCIQQVLPESLKRQPMDNATYRAAFGAVMPLFRNFTVTVDDVFEDEAGNKVAMSVRSTADTPIGPKIVRVREFVDSATSSKFFARLGEMAEKEGNPWNGAAAAWKAAPSGIGKSSKGSL
ncbi:hypothetical protein LQW54_006641 [Pestalotiopsis sp. IQ-011]